MIATAPLAGTPSAINALATRRTVRALPSQDSSRQAPFSRHLKASSGPRFAAISKYCAMVVVMVPPLRTGAPYRAAPRGDSGPLRFLVVPGRSTAVATPGLS